MEDGWAALPSMAAWRHIEARDGFEVVFPTATTGGWSLRGTSTGVEDGIGWAVGYRVDVDDRWQTTTAEVWNRTTSGERRTVLERSPDGRWTVDGRPRPDLDGCVDVDLEASAVTNTLPVHRLAFGADPLDAPAAYVRAADLAVERLEQRYRRLGPDGDGASFHYESPRFGFEAHLRFDRSGLVLDYPGLAARSA